MVLTFISNCNSLENFIVTKYKKLFKSIELFQNMSLSIGFYVSPSYQIDQIFPKLFYLVYNMKIIIIIIYKCVPFSIKIYFN
jgi:hypothetical protein